LASKGCSSSLASEEGGLTSEKGGSPK
jgi:hypothetical protein